MLPVHVFHYTSSVYGWNILLVYKVTSTYEIM